MKHRKLRIAWSVTCGVLAVLLVALWLRSYQIVESLDAVSNSEMETRIASDMGTILFHRADLKQLEGFLPPQPQNWKYHDFEPNFDRKFSSFVFTWNKNELEIRCPYWCPILLVALIAVTPWMMRFSLRTLLIATTLIALVLGIIVWMSRAG